MRLFSFSDSHLGFRQYGFDKRKEDFRFAIDDIRHTIQATPTIEEVDGIIMAGDIFHTMYPSGDDVNHIRQFVECFAEDNIPVYGITGNHDNDESWLHVCGINSLEKWNADEPVIARINKGKVFGINYCYPAFLAAKLDKLNKYCKESKETLDVLVLHTDILEMAAFSSISVEEILARTKDAKPRVIILGHLHNHKEMIFNNTLVLNNGSTELVASNEDTNKVLSEIVITSSDKPTVDVYPIKNRPILNIRVTSQEDIKAVTTSTAKWGEEYYPLLYLSTTPEMADEAKKLYQWLRTRSMCLFKVDGVLSEAELEDIQTDKGNTMSVLKSLVEKTFKDDPDKNSLIMNLIQNPSQVEAMVVKFANSKGLSLAS